MNKIMVFAGTIEGRMLAQYLPMHCIKTYVCVATEYGGKLLEDNEYLTVSTRRLSEEEMASLMTSEEITSVVDATHPYATEVSKNIKNACKNSNIEYIRLLRESNEIQTDNSIYFNNTKEVVEYLEKVSGNVLLTTGSKELKEYTKLSNYKNRIYARVLSSKEVVSECYELGFEGKYLICMQGPFSEELNYAMIKQVNAQYIVTKESGTQGGYAQKLEAANRAGITSLIIGRPTKEEGLSYQECRKYLNKKYDIKKNIEVTILGIGMGNEVNLTLEAINACNSAEIILGAKRITDSLKKFHKPIFNAYESREIYNFIKNDCEVEKIVIAVSGDVGFYSGAKKIIEALKEYRPKVICGISSVVYFASKVLMSWDDVKLVSMHGRNNNIIAEIKNHTKVFSLLDGKDSVKDLCKKLVGYGMTELTVYVGENLSYPNEIITRGNPKDFINKEVNSLSVIIIENQKAKDFIVTHGIEDKEFIRDEVPMTKEEIRSISLSKLKLTKSSIVYDIGAGTGSVSIEMGRLATAGEIYAIEKNHKAIELIEKNSTKFGVDNIIIIEDTAPCLNEEIVAPSHAFIGGSSGNMKSIFTWLLNKNPNIRIVINTITLESLSEALACLKEFNLINIDIVQASISKSRNVGNYNLMTGLNPVYIISCTGGGVNGPA